MNKLVKISASASLVLALGLLLVVPKAHAIVIQEKVSICHRTNSVTNPYGPNPIEVNASAADGDTSNDQGQGDHSEHTGPVATSEAVAQALKDAKLDWGDIIPPHHNFAGLNWTAEGQAVYNNNCQYAVVPPVVPPVTPENGQVLSTTAPQVTAPTGGVSAGAGSAVGSLLGLGGSLAVAGVGASRLLRRS